jgi:hypothetical protein
MTNSLCVKLVILKLRFFLWHLTMYMMLRHLKILNDMKTCTSLSNDKYYTPITPSSHWVDVINCDLLLLFYKGSYQPNEKNV